MSTKTFETAEGRYSALQPDALLEPSPTRLDLALCEPVQVREPQKIPKKIRDFFRIDLKTGLPLSTEKRIFLSQVLMHEFDEGARLLQKAGRHEIADFVKSNHPQMHLSNQLRLLRDTLEEKSISETAPEEVRGGNKIRNNQTGRISGKSKNGIYFGFSSEGVLYKGRNEDALLVDPDQEFIAVLDGMGGHRGGNIASGVMTDFIEYGLHHGMNSEQALCFANEAILQRARNDAKLGGLYPMGTTLVCAEIQGNKLKTIHVGDSKLLVIRQGKIVFETQDHTNGQCLYREGLVDLDTAHFLNHILSRNLGSDPILPNRDLEKNTFLLKTGDRVLLASDGITDNFYSEKFTLEELAQIVSGESLESCAQKVKDLCLQRMKEGKLASGYRAKPDNISLALYQYQP